jgi:hypothetical protein
LGFYPKFYFSARRDPRRPFAVSCILSGYCLRDFRDLINLNLIGTCIGVSTYANVPQFPACLRLDCQHAAETLVVRSRLGRADRQRSVQLSNSRSLPKPHRPRTWGSFSGARIPCPGRCEQLAGSSELTIRFGRWAFGRGAGTRHKQTAANWRWRLCTADRVHSDCSRQQSGETIKNMFT